jgi:Membrane-fusion protein
MFVRAVLQEAVNEQGILVPQRSVGRDTMGRPTVYCLSENNTVVEEVVELDRSLGQNYLVRSGLKAGARVVVDGRIKVRPGLQVNATPLETPGPVANANAPATK